MRRRLGNEFLDYAIDPFVSGIYAGDPEQISVPAAFPRLHALEQKYGSLIRGQIMGARERRKNPEKAKNAAKSFSFDRGMQVFPRALAGRLAHYLPGTRVESIARRPGGDYEVRALRAGVPVTFAARVLVVAAPAYRAAAFLEPLSAPLARALEAIRYAPVAVVASAYRREDVGHDLAGFGFLVPKKERRRILGSLFSSSMFEGRAPAGHVLLTTFVGGLRNPEMTTLADGELTGAVEGELAALVGAGKPLWHEIVRWTHAIPQYTIGHLERIAAVDRAAAAFPGLFWCANWRGGVSVSDCVKNGHAMAGTPARASYASWRPQFQQSSKFDGESSPQAAQCAVPLRAASSVSRASRMSARSRSASRSSQTCGCATSGGTSPTMLDACWLKTCARMPAWFSRSATRKASKRACAT